jgi:hypothetical protein
MAHLSLVKSLAHLKEEQRYSDEIVLDAFGLTLKRGSITEIAGGPSTGKTSFAFHLLAKLTTDGEVCALVDSCGGFDAVSAAASGVELKNLLWIKCGGDIEKSFLAADYLVQAKGFGCIWLNLNGLPNNKLRLVPKTYWYRYRTRIKETPTMLVVTSPDAVTGSASQHAFTFERKETVWSGRGRFKLLSEFYLRVLSRKTLYGEISKAEIEMDYLNAEARA